MESLNLDQMEEIQGGWVDTAAGAACGLALGGVFAGGFGFAVTAMMFGPSCIGLVIAM
ncbi:hypothetical protein [Flammeovirga pacifica]|uniref:hypothetical protein n=1 Tax=Flammeovirga pacifica TaxID=915059 RepID=UPI000B29BA27|nr:hypothetical protein [Flammeovirga pacifica]